MERGLILLPHRRRKRPGCLIKNQTRRRLRPPGFINNRKCTTGFINIRRRMRPQCLHSRRMGPPGLIKRQMHPLNLVNRRMHSGSSRKSLESQPDRNLLSKIRLFQQSLYMSAAL